MSSIVLDFEKPVLDLEKRIKELKEVETSDTKLLSALEKEFEEKIARIYKYLTPYEILLVARHPLRPKADDYISSIFEEFLEIKGDRIRGNDKATVAGIGLLEGRQIGVLGTRKYSEFQKNLEVNFGMPSFSGFKKAERLFELALKYNFPIINFVDTPGALYGAQAEIEGTFFAISSVINKALSLKVPIISVIIGEAESTGSLPFLIGDKIFMLKYSILSVISPELASLILFKDKTKIQDASYSLRLTEDEIKKFSIIDSVIDEPTGGAHRNREKVIKEVSLKISEALGELKNVNLDELLVKRSARYASLNFFETEDLY